MNRESRELVFQTSTVATLTGIPTVVPNPFGSRLIKRDLKVRKEQ